MPNTRLKRSPTSFAPVFDAAVDIVEKSNFQYHMLSLQTDSEYPLSIILVGAGDGPWDAMQYLDDNLPQRALDNFQVLDMDHFWKWFQTKILQTTTWMQLKRNQV